MILTSSQIALHLSIFVVSIILFFSARWVLGIFTEDDHLKLKITAMRWLIGLFFVMQVLDIVLFHTIETYENIFFKIGFSIITIYSAMVISNLINFLVRRRFGDERQVSERKFFQDTYSSRLANIFCFIGLILIVIYFLINIWGLESLLETTGFFGLVFAFFAFTSGIWGPDIYYGMVILNSEILESGDVIRMDGHYYIINRVNFVYTVLLNVNEAHRTIIRNSQFLQSKIENLTRLASTDGLREKLVFKVSYPRLSSLPQGKRKEALESFMDRINKMFEATKKEALERLELNEKSPFKWVLSKTGDYALEFTLYYSLKPLPSTRLVKKIRERMTGTRNAVNEIVYRNSIIYGVDLSTPIVISHANEPGFVDEGGEIAS